jgi:hypothetical protein
MRDVDMNEATLLPNFQRNFAGTFSRARDFPRGGITWSENFAYLWVTNPKSNDVRSTFVARALTLLS